MSRKRRTTEDGDDEEEDRGPHKRNQAFGGSDGGNLAFSFDSQDKSLRKTLFKSYTQSLNEQFRAYIASRDTNELWTDAVGEYQANVASLLEEFKDVIDTSISPTISAAPPPAPAPDPAAIAVEPAATITFGKPVVPSGGSKPAFLFGSSAVGAEKQTTLTTPASSSNGFSFGTDLSAKPALVPKAALFTFPSPAVTSDTPTLEATKPTSSTFSFGSSIPPAGANATADSAPAAPAAPFAFGQASAAIPSSNSTVDPPLFSFGASAASAAAAPSAFTFGAAPSSFGAPLSFGPPAAFGAPAAAATEEEGGEEEEPQKFESEVAVNEDAGSILFKVKSKFSHLHNKAWEGKGVGTLMIRKKGSDKPLITFTTEAGRVLYITNLPKVMSVILNNERNSLSFSAPWSPDGVAPPTSQGVMFQLPKGKNAEFKAEVEKQQGLM